MNDCSFSCHLPLILIWKESIRPLTAINTDHEQTLSNNKILPSFSSSRFDRTLTDCMQSGNSRNNVELNEIFSTHSPPTKFRPNYNTACTSVFDPEVYNQHSLTIIIKNLTDQVKLNTGTQFNVRKQIPLMWTNTSLFMALTAISKLYVHQLTGFCNFSSNKDWLYFPSIHISLVMTIVMLITFPPMSVR